MRGEARQVLAGLAGYVAPAMSAASFQGCFVDDSGDASIRLAITRSPPQRVQAGHGVTGSQGHGVTGSQDHGVTGSQSRGDGSDGRGVLLLLRLLLLLLLLLLLAATAVTCLD